MVTTEEYVRAESVASYEVGAQGVLKFSVLLRMAQETSEQHLGALGLGYEKLKVDGLVFLITNNLVQIKRMPRHNDRLVIKTHPRGTAGVQFYRDFVFYIGEEEVIRIMQTSVSADPASHKILRPKVFLGYDVFQDEKMEKDGRIDRVTPPEGGLPLLGERPIRYSDLDFNRHLNNAIYGDILLDYLPEAVRARGLSQVQISYVNESVLGETLRVYGGETEEGEYLLYGNNARGLGFSAKLKK